MRALRIDGGRPHVVDLPDPLPARGEAVVRVALAGICGTDLEIARGYMGFSGVPGHEFVGRVEQAPDPAWTGRRALVVGAAPYDEGADARAALRRALAEAGRDGVPVLVVYGANWCGDCQALSSSASTGWS